MMFRLNKHSSNRKGFEFKQWSFYVFGIHVLTFDKGVKSGWVRFTPFMFGFSWKNRSEGQRFSERIGISKQFSIFNYRFMFYR